MCLVQGGDRTIMIRHASLERPGEFANRLVSGVVIAIRNHPANLLLDMLHVNVRKIALQGLHI